MPRGRVGIIIYLYPAGTASLTMILPSAVHWSWIVPHTVQELPIQQEKGELKGKEKKRKEKGKGNVRGGYSIPASALAWEGDIGWDMEWDMG